MPLSFSVAGTKPEAALEPRQGFAALPKERVDSGAA